MYAVTIRPVRSDLASVHNVYPTRGQAEQAHERISRSAYHDANRFVMGIYRTNDAAIRRVMIPATDGCDWSPDHDDG